MSTDATSRLAGLQVRRRTLSDKEGSGQVVVATTTFYKSVEELRFRLACSLVEKSVAAGHIVTVVDASPIPEVAERLRALGAHVFPQLHKGMGPGRRQVFWHAQELGMQEGIDITLWTEPEKDDLIRSIPQIIQPIIGVEPPHEAADIVIPRRSKASWETWPKFQRQSEQKANAVYDEMFGGLFEQTGLDPMFGPVAFCHQVAEYFAFCNTAALGVPDTYVQHYAPCVAAAIYGANVVSAEIDMVYPPEQRVEEEGTLNDAMRKKRRDQLETLTAAYQILARKL